MKILVMGAGAVGAYFGARLQQAGEQVVFCARGEHLRALKDRGLAFTSYQGDFSIAVTATGDTGREAEVARRAEHAASSLSALGVQTAVLDGDRVTTVLTTAVDPYTPVDATWARARPDAAITHTGAPS